MRLAAELVAALTERRLTIAVAESLTGGLLVAELIAVPGASAVVRGGVVAYSTELKHTLLGVPDDVLAAHGPVHPNVAGRMASGVRNLLAVDGVPADIGLSTTGVAGPDPQGEQQPGTVFVGVAMGADVRVVALHLEGTRTEIRDRVVSESLAALKALLDG
ncbi:MAG: damage-inducible protein CinA [Microbacteriaceae bacterium]|jgi:nicotinamide-nucleotide amidase|nr:damage-inducible protein CinA [Microbacteriaceae bacterium]HEV7957771.1 nicotinamide-nucleotide amidohydrolase family protein [Marisediminicola sp.]